MGAWGLLLGGIRIMASADFLAGLAGLTTGFERGVGIGKENREKDRSRQERKNAAALAQRNLMSQREIDKQIRRLAQQNYEEKFAFDLSKEGTRAGEFQDTHGLRERGLAQDLGIHKDTFGLESLIAERHQQNTLEDQDYRERESVLTHGDTAARLGLDTRAQTALEVERVRQRQEGARQHDTGLTEGGRQHDTSLAEQARTTDLLEGGRQGRFTDELLNRKDEFGRTFTQGVHEFSEEMRQRGEEAAVAERVADNSIEMAQNKDQREQEILDYSTLEDPRTILPGVDGFVSMTDQQAQEYTTNYYNENIGKTPYTDPESGQQFMLTPEAAAASSERDRIRAEEARQRDQDAQRDFLSRNAGYMFESSGEFGGSTFSEANAAALLNMWQRTSGTRDATPGQPLVEEYADITNMYDREGKYRYRDSELYGEHFGQMNLASPPLTPTQMQDTPITVESARQLARMRYGHPGIGEQSGIPGMSAGRSIESDPLVAEMIRQEGGVPNTGGRFNPFNLVERIR